ncbi:protein-disulfide reductase DsbD domain-containing protein [Ferrovibrio sp.]|uniref:protein-disulfide reductase DsbD domain-containing protein n=1 Tax=Ferrovibrio sp. TaxID=1917215 RepID=UPI003D0B87BB
MRIGIWAFVAAVGLSLLNGGVLAAEPLRARLVQGAEGYAGLHLRLEPGWKFYWRQPGEGGVPPRFDWSGSGNLASVDVEWPAPRRMSISGIDLIGYKGEVVLPLRVQAQKATKPVTLKLLAEFGICKEICVLREERLTLTLNPGEGPAAALIERFRAEVPGSLAAAGIQVPSFRQKEGKLLLKFAPEARLEAPDIFVEGPVEYWFGRPKLLPQADGSLELALPYTPVDQPPALGGLRFTLVDGRRSAEFTP